MLCVIVHSNAAITSGIWRMHTLNCMHVLCMIKEKKKSPNIPTITKQ